MIILRCAVLIALVVALQMAGFASTQAADNYPNRPIRIVVGTAAGGGTDTNIRAIKAKLEERLGVPIIIDNRPGGSNQIAVQAVTNAAPDGYVLLAGTMGMLAINPAIYPKLAYDTMRDLVPISIVCTYPMLIVVNATAPVKSISELVEYIKANPSKANVAGTGAVYGITNKLFELRTGVKTQFVPYRSSGESLTALIRGDVLMAVVETTSVAGHLKDGRVKVLSVLSNQRLPGNPDIPTSAEAGMKDFEVELWTGLLAPRGTPPAIVQKLNEAIVSAVRSEDVRKVMGNLQLVPVGDSSSDYAARLKHEIGMWADVAKVTDFKVQQ